MAVLTRFAMKATSNATSIIRGMISPLGVNYVSIEVYRSRRLIEGQTVGPLLCTETSGLEEYGIFFNMTFYSDVTRRVTSSCAAAGWQKREVGGHFPCVYGLQ